MIDLDRIERLLREHSDSPLAKSAQDLVTEVRALRAGLEEALDEMADGTSITHRYSADIEALEKLAGIDPRQSCSQCGWSGRAFHACEGVSGGFGSDDDA